MHLQNRMGQRENKTQQARSIHSSCRHRGTEGLLTTYEEGCCYPMLECTDCRGSLFFLLKQHPQHSTPRAYRQQQARNGPYPKQARYQLTQARKLSSAHL